MANLALTLSSLYRKDLLARYCSINFLSQKTTKEVLGSIYKKLVNTTEPSQSSAPKIFVDSIIPELISTEHAYSSYLQAAMQHSGDMTNIKTDVCKAAYVERVLIAYMIASYDHLYNYFSRKNFGFPTAYNAKFASMQTPLFLRQSYTSFMKEFRGLVNVFRLDINSKRSR